MCQVYTWGEMHLNANFEANQQRGIEMAGCEGDITFVISKTTLSAAARTASTAVVSLSREIDERCLEHACSTGVIAAARNSLVSLMLSIAICIALAVADTWLNILMI